MSLGQTVLAEFAYTVDTDGQRSRAVETDDQGRTTTIDWVYDELGRLTEERYDAEGTANDFIARYAFDLASNRVKLSKDEENADRLLFAADEVTEYFYDANDRLTRETFDADNDGNVERTTVYDYNGTEQTTKTVWQGDNTDPGTGTKQSQTTYEYNLQGRLEKIEIDSDGVGGVDERYTYKYNDAGIRVSSTDVAGETTLYHVDSNNHTGYAQVLEEGVDDGDGRLQPTDIDTTYTLGHDVIAQQSDTEQGGQTLALLPDGHGSTRALITAALTLAEKYAYDAYGNMLPGAGLHTDPATALTSLLYSGEQTDPTGQQYLRARYYDPTVGRFNRLDPFAGRIQDPLSLHKYLYGNGNPLLFSDPSGKFGVTGLSAGLSIAGGLQNLKIEADLFAFDVAVTFLDALESGQTAWEAFGGFLNNQALGFGAGWLMGTAIGWATTLRQQGITIGGARASRSGPQTAGQAMAHVRGQWRNFRPARLQDGAANCGVFCGIELLSRIRPGQKLSLDVYAGVNAAEVIASNNGRGLNSMQVRNLLDNNLSDAAVSVEHNVTIDQLEAFMGRGEVIAHVDGNHFVYPLRLTDEAGRKWVDIYDPAVGYYEMTLDSLMTRAGSNPQVVFARGF